MLASKFLYKVCHLTGITRLAAWFTRNDPVIICYHNISNSPRDVREDPWKLTILAADFERQISYLKSHYKVVPLSVALDPTFKAKPDTAVLTFDDGERSFLTVAAPILAKYSLPATVNIITDYADRMSETPGDANRKYLSWAEITQLTTTRDIEVGSHTCSHPRLTEISPEGALQELVQSREAIKTRTGADFIAISYPHGLFSTDLAVMAKQSGYDCALTAVEGKTTRTADKFQLDRIVVLADDDQWMFAARLAGITAYLPAARSWIRRSIKEPLLRFARFREAKNVRTIPEASPTRLS